jgi:hypothetical protein
MNSAVDRVGTSLLHAPSKASAQAGNVESGALIYTPN